MQSILSVPFYDTRVQQYTKILCVNAVPVAGPLAARVKTVRPPRLSGLSGNGNGRNCIHAITRAGCSCSYMTPDDLPELFAFLAANGYTVDTGLTKLAAKHQPGGSDANANSLVCIISHA
ncbi:MAG: hypothetical protein EBU92_10725 [Betaproteobacteria bacterium]|jgi:hypothetical protein|nr:hypothetical protein [Betaproteobacteria bacterium]